ncbi:MAG: shikimate kinase [Actinobacteria bacterium]|nr:shikimate kinase [Actinomycetota bacterium]MCL5446331.1 shikimate kinase [Actinomycetota bacterium]
MILVGMPGSGKTVVGAMLAERLGWNFVDVDALIEDRLGKPVAEIFVSPEYGEAGFRMVERDTVAEVVISPQRVVIATGGGCVEDEVTRGLLASETSVVWLVAKPGVLFSRVGMESGRPLLAVDPAGSLERLLAKREPLYRAVSDLVIDTSGLDVSQVVEKILENVVLMASLQDGFPATQLRLPVPFAGEDDG